MQFSQVCWLNRVLTVMILGLLVGCSSNDYPLSEHEKANMVAELISSTQSCAAFKEKLTSPAMDSAAIDAVYNDATKAGCIKKDI